MSTDPKKKAAEMARITNRRIAMVQRVKQMPHYTDM